MRNDYCLRGTANQDQVRFFVSSTRNMVDTARIKHGLSPLATAALGRTLTAASMMGMTLKGADQLTITFKGDGVLGTILARSNSEGEVKGYVEHPEVELPLKDNGKIDVSGGVGFGTLYITKDMGLKDPYVGTVPIVSGEIGEDLTEYFYSSEQVLSAVGLGVLVDVDHSVLSSGGFILQLMPGAEEVVGISLDEKVQELPPLSGYFLEHSPEELLTYFFGEDVKILEKKEVAFSCGCSKENFSQALLTLASEDLEHLAKDPQVEVVCQFCNEKYLFSQEEIQSLEEINRNN